MLSSTYCCDSSYIPLGKRRGRLDLARSSLDLSWARAVSDSAHSRAYPSPPMSGSPPLPSRRNPDFDDRGQGGYNISVSGQDVPRASQPPQTESREISRAAPGRPFQPESYMPSPYPYQRVAGLSSDSSQPHSQYVYPQHQQNQRPHPQMAGQLPLYPLRHQASGAFLGSDGGTIADAPGYTSPKTQRKTKGHVASACVPCKRAHLRCDAQRPCSRCTSNSKEEACIDVQHKKRGRPRLRDERESRYDALGQHFAAQPEQLMRRPTAVYSPNESAMHQPEALHRASSYRVIKSHTGTQMVPRYLDRASITDANIFSSSQLSQTPHIIGPPEQPCAYMNMEMQMSRASRTFCEATGNPSVTGRKLLEIVSPNDRDKVYRLQRLLEEEQQEREPNYLPPIYGKTEEERVIQSIGFGLEDLAQFRTDRQELLTFQGPDGQQRPCHVRLGLAKRESTYFVVLVILLPSTPAASRGMHQLSSPPHPRGSGFHTPQQSFAPSPMPSYGQYPAQLSEPRHEPQMTYRQPQPLRSNTGSSTAITSSKPSYAQPFVRPEYGRTQYTHQIPRSELPQGTNQHQNELRLPPIQNTPEGASVGGQRVEGRGGRVDIGGLLESPDSQRRRR